MTGDIFSGLERGHYGTKKRFLLYQGRDLPIYNGLEKLVFMDFSKLFFVVVSLKGKRLKELCQKVWRIYNANVAGFNGPDKLGKMLKKVWTAFS